MAGDAIVHLQIDDQHEREEDEEGAECEREALLELHVEHDARGVAARRGLTARMVGRRRALSVARAHAPATPPRARPPGNAATTHNRQRASYHQGCGCDLLNAMMFRCTAKVNRHVNETTRSVKD